MQKSLTFFSSAVSSSPCGFALRGTGWTGAPDRRRGRFGGRVIVPAVGTAPLLGEKDEGEEEEEGWVGLLFMVCAGAGHAV